MAKFIVPKIAVNFPDSKGRYKQKWHLLKVHGEYAGEGVTICRRFCEEWHERPIIKLSPEDLCKICLGPLKVE